jgi:hypothetical protein
VQLAGCTFMVGMEAGRQGGGEAGRRGGMEAGNFEFEFWNLSGIWCLESGIL